MASQIFSEFIDATGRSYPFLPEWTRGWLVLTAAPGELAAARLLRQGQPLELIVRKHQGEARLMAEWPLAAAGATRLDWLLPSRRVHEQHWVQPLKLTLEQVSLLLQELQWDIPAALLHSLHPQAALASAEVGAPATQTTLAEERYRLLQAMRQLLPLLQPLHARARYHLKPETVWRPVARVRRPHLQGRALLTAHSPGAWCADQGAQPNWDTPIHRYIAGLCREIDDRLRRLHRLRPQDPALGAAQAALSAAVPSWLAVLPVQQLTPAALLPLRQDPLYQGFYALEQHLRQSWVLALPAAVADAPMAHLPMLYQWWGTLQVWQSLAGYLLQQGFVLGEAAVVPRGLQPWPQGQLLLGATHADGRCVRLMPEVTFTSRGVWQSMSYRQRPDIVVEISGAGPARLLVLDPKYRLESERQGGATSRPRKADLDRLHAYRDALRNRQGELGVVCAVLMYPGETYRFSQGLLALRACPGEPVLQAELTALWQQFIAGGLP